MATSRSATRNDRAIDPATEQVATVYARALLGAAVSTGAPQAVLDELDSFVADVLAPHPKFVEVLESGLVSPDDKLAMLDRVLGGKAQPAVLNFLKVLTKRGRFAAVGDVARIARKLYDARLGRTAVDVTTAQPLPATESAAIRDRLQVLFGGEPVLHPMVDPEIIGGLILRVGDQVYDGSVATQLARARTQMIDRSIHEIQSRRDRFGNPAGN
jgi:F-type H+-transporting ATPase subunit delta